MIDMPSHNRWLTPLLAVLFVVCLFLYWSGASLAALLCRTVPTFQRSRGAPNRMCGLGPRWAEPACVPSSASRNSWAGSAVAVRPEVELFACRGDTGLMWLAVSECASTPC